MFWPAELFIVQLDEKCNERMTRVKLKVTHNNYKLSNADWRDNSELGSAFILSLSPPARRVIICLYAGAKNCAKINKRQPSMQIISVPPLSSSVRAGAGFKMQIHNRKSSRGDYDTRENYGKKGWHGARL